MAKRRKTKKTITPQASGTNSRLIPILVVVGIVIITVGTLILVDRSANQLDVTVAEITYPVGVTAEGEPYKGGDDAAVVIEEFADFQCSHCFDFHQEVKAISDEYIETGQVKFIFRNFAFLGQGSTNAAEAAECALDQGPEAFWRYHDAIFANAPNGQQVFTRGALRELAEQVGLDTDQFNRCFNGGQKLAEVQQDLRYGQDVGVDSTPSMLINGELVRGGMDAAALRSTIDALLDQ